MSNYSALILAQGATQYWSLDEPSIPYIDAVSGMQLDHSENATSEPGAVHSGVSFPGTSLVRGLTLDSTVAFNVLQGFSYSYLVQFANYSVNRGVISKRRTGTVARTFSSFVFNQGTTSGLTFDIGHNQIRWSTGYYPPAKEWVHIAYTYDPTTVTGRAYVNGQLIGSNTYDTPPTDTQTSAHIMIGALQGDVAGGASSYMSGMIDEIALFTTKTLSPEEIRAQYAIALPVMRIYDGSQWLHADKKVIGA